MNANAYQEALLNTFFTSQTTGNYPPYNIIKDGANYIIEYGVAGFTKDDLDVEYDGRLLIVSARKDLKDDREYTHRGLSKRTFNHTIAVRGAYDVGDVILTDGILYIKMIDKTERIKPKIQIGVVGGGYQDKYIDK